MIDLSASHDSTVNKREENKEDDENGTLTAVQAA